MVQWNSIHGDMRNSDGFAYPTSDRYEVVSRTLEGAAILFGPAIDATGNLYVCSGRGAPHAHLHSYSPDGTLRWESAPYDGAETLGPRVCPFAPLLDDQGRVFVADERAVWCFDSSGQVRWQTALAPLGIHAGFPSLVLSPRGDVAGISLDGVVMLLDPESGEPSLAPFPLPTGDAPPPLSAQPALWKGMMDESTIRIMYPAFFGSGFPVTNSPAVSSSTGCIYITGAAENPGKTCLYGLSDAGSSITLQVTAEFDGFCSVTPSVSPDGTVFYTGNHRGELMAFDARDGRRLWSYSPGATAASRWRLRIRPYSIGCCRW